MSIARNYEFDAAVLDREERPFALIEVKSGTPAHGWSNWLRNMLQGAGALRTDYVIAIDLASIRLYPIHESIPGEPVLLETTSVLSHYDPDFARKRIFEPYLLTLVEAWLRDLAYHWKNQNPPGTEELKSTGFLDRVMGGTTVSGFRLESL